MGIFFKTIVITGASKGIGAEIACKLGKLGARVVLLARDIEAVKNGRSWTK